MHLLPCCTCFTQQDMVIILMDFPHCQFLTPTAKQNAELRGTVGSGVRTPPPMAAALP